MSADNLAPCPKCGSVAVPDVRHGQWEWWYCEKCGHEWHTDPADNLRPSLDEATQQIHSRLDELKAAADNPPDLLVITLVCREGLLAEVSQRLDGLTFDMEIQHGR